MTKFEISTHETFILSQNLKIHCEINQKSSVSNFLLLSMNKKTLKFTRGLITPSGMHTNFKCDLAKANRALPRKDSKSSSNVPFMLTTPNKSNMDRNCMIKSFDVKSFSHIKRSKR